MIRFLEWLTALAKKASEQKMDFDFWMKLSMLVFGAGIAILTLMMCAAIIAASGPLGVIPALGVFCIMTPMAMMCFAMWSDPK